MTMFNTLRSLVAAASPDGGLPLDGGGAAEPEDHQDHTAAMPAARQRLRDALAEQLRLRATHEECTAATLRVRAIIAAVQPAQAAAKEAAQAAAAATRAWAVSGARADVPDGDKRLLDAAADALRQAQDAEFKAAGARAALSEVVEAENSARNARESADSEIKEARTVVLIAQHAEPLFAELEHARLRYMEGLHELAALAVLLDSRLGSMHPWRKLVTGDHNFKQRLAALAIPVPEERELGARAEAWARAAARLAENPDGVKG
jgi:hypothetical protein